MTGATAQLTITADQRRARLAERHRLLPERRTDDVPTIATDLVALHSTDPVTVYLSTLARMATPGIPAVEDALYTARAVMRHHVMRRTLWVTTPEVMRLLNATTTARYAPAEHRRLVKMLEDNGIEDGDTWLTAAKRDVLTLLRDEGPMAARALGQRVPALAHPLHFGAGTRYEGVQSAHSRVLLQLGFEGALLRTRPIGSWVSGQYTWAATESWLPGSLDPVDDERGAAREAARAWLLAFGPGTAADLQWYMAWTATMTRQALADAEAVGVRLPESGPDEGWISPEDLDADWPTRCRPWVAVLPGLDPTTMGWKQREFYLPAAAAPVFDSNGNAGPTIWVDGRVVGGWAQTKDGDTRLIWFGAVPAARRRQVKARLEQVRDWVGDARFSVRFPAPYTKPLLTGEQAVMEAHG